MNSLYYSLTVPDAGDRQKVVDRIHDSTEFWDEERLFQTEGYMKHHRPLFTRLPFPYYHIPAGARNLMLRAYKGLDGVRGREFPAWPIEPTLDSKRRLIWRLAAGLAGVELRAMPYPGVSRFACLLTHDIDSGAAQTSVDSIRAVEGRYRVKSAWSFASGRYEPSQSAISRLVADGCEILSHGDGHDGKLPYLRDEKIRAALKDIFVKMPWLHQHIYGFRAELAMRGGNLQRILPEFFDYDMSYPDTEMYGPYGRTSGCCTVYPFMLDNGMLEIPFTLPQDFFLLKVHRVGLDGLLRIWKEKVDYIEKLHGVATVCLHPDHVQDIPGLLAVYDEFIRYVTSKPVWMTTPHQMYEFCKGRM